MKKIRVGAVSYLNTKPLLYGIKNHPIINEIELVEDYPANIAHQLQQGQLDIGLIPVAATRHLQTWKIVSDYGISCDGEVASVCLFSDVPMEEIENVYLDYQSRTSVNLAKLLLQEYWQKPVNYIATTGEDFRTRITGSTAGVVIGDRALEQRLKSSYIYDLGTAWKQYTGLPFVFAAWIGREDLHPVFKQKFNEANAHGLTHIDQVVRENPFSAYDLHYYFTKCIHYQLTDKKLEGLELFLQKLSTLSSHL